VAQSCSKCKSNTKSSRSCLFQAPAQLLVERASPFAGRDDVAPEAREFVLNNPVVLKKVDPASVWLAPSLPNIVDSVADGHIELARVVAEHHGILTEKHAVLKSAVTDNKASGDQALAQAYELLWGYFARQVWELAQAASDQKLETDKELQVLRAENHKDNEAATARLTLLERSVWRKFYGLPEKYET
jgi:hypothetical protein